MLLHIQVHIDAVSLTVTSVTALTWLDKNKTHFKRSFIDLMLLRSLCYFVLGIYVVNVVIALFLQSTRGRLRNIKYKIKTILIY